MTKPPYIEENILLAPYTTLGVGGCAQYFANIESEEMLHEVVLWAEERTLPITVLGGGSNVLIPDAGVEGVVLHMSLARCEYDERDDFVYATVGAGVILDTLVDELVSRGLWGLENLSAIPGTVGATPVQNVGAYGVEVKDVIHEVRVYDRRSHTFLTLTNDACEFGYRDSLFKREGGKQYIVVRVTFRTSRTPHRVLGYKDLRERFGDTEPTLADVRAAVIEIRSQKFPDWHTLGTAGSFFKNPSVSQSEYEALSAQYPQLPGYVQADGTVKLSLGWILDHVLHYKGYRVEHVGLYAQQALVLVNHGGASSDEIKKFSQSVIDAVFDATHVIIEREVVLV